MAISETPSLERLVRGINQSPSIRFTDSSGNEAQPYILPTPFVGEKSLKGFFNVEDTLVEREVGFKYKNTYYNFNKSAKIEKVDSPSENVSYLELIPMSYKVGIGSGKGNNFKPQEGSPFMLMGLIDAEEPQPLIYCWQNDNMCCSGVYKSKNGDLNTVDLGPVVDGLQLQKHYFQIKSLPRRKEPQEKKTSSATLKDADKIDFHDPKSLIEFFDRHVIGQRQAKEALAIAISEYKLALEDEGADVSSEKENILLIGPSGSGKTMMVELIGRVAGLPLGFTKATGKSSVGYVGGNIQEPYERIHAALSNDLGKHRRPYGLAFFDEFDKLAHRNLYNSSYGAELINELVAMIERAEITFGKNNEIKFDTSNVLNIFAGAFHEHLKGDGLVQIIKKRLHGGRKIGFLSESQSGETAIFEILHKVVADDLITYGFSRELVGRIPMIGVLDPLSCDDLIKILMASESSPIISYTRKLARRGFSLQFDEDAAAVVASQCPRETGARALKSVCANLFKPIRMNPEKFAGENNTLTVSGSLVQEILNSS